MYPGQLMNEWALRVVADGRVCSAATTSLTVQQVRYDSTGRVTSLQATFGQSCMGDPVGMNGRILFNADSSLYVVSPQDVYASLVEPLSFVVTAVSAQHSSIGLSATGVPAGASFTDLGNGTGNLAWPAGSATAGTFLVSFTATDSLGRTASAVTAIRVHGPNIMRLDADAGEYLTQGIPHLLHDANATLSNWTNCCGAASAMAATPEEAFHVAFAAPNPRPLSAGHYVAQSAPAGEYAAAMGIEAPGRGCNVATGWFDVRQITFDGSGQLSRLWVLFEHHCEGGAPAVRGEVRINADTSIYVLPPADIYLMAHRDTSVVITAKDTRGNPVALTAAMIPPGCSFSDLGDGTGVMSITRAMTQTGLIPVSFTCTNGLGSQASATTWLHVYPTTASTTTQDGPRRLSLERAGTNPARAPMSLSFSLPDYQPAQLELLDVSGRTVLAREVGMLGPGGHQLQLLESRVLLPGMYWARLRHGEERIVRTVVLLR